ncbi:putative glucose-methanol-choline oxidoreductase protein [Neofusicoccum parvum UCRNP2]|uniref:Putative glucose-methanol-choline oxidoreductase protein n=1 Tax=Botryosphaeria parva (strain UCR-NP2) TaxID=1287680 RepID=R1GKB6_BOTPV|nr:putative glucose-methanol-choline oxidoreductase protein [Neofusicoccum parvum UCRNP2]
MYQLILGEGQNAFVGKGLGGTSLINANVFLECDKRTLALPAWPPELRKDPNALDPYYARATEMLQPTPYPDDYPLLKKLSVLEKQAEALGQKENFYRVPQTTFFRNGLNNKELCFLGAGALGTTEILLRSRARGLKMSRLAGQKLSGNGDILSFGYNTEEIVNGVGRAKPSTETFNQQEEITVHPLGGAIMSSDGTGRSGVTNHLGQVFSGEDSEVHGGVNPFATITALAERSVDAIAKDRAYQIDMLTKNGKLDLFGKPAKSVPLTLGMMNAQKAMEKSTKSRGVQFTEIMDGHIHIGDNIGDYTIAEKVAKGGTLLNRASAVTDFMGNFAQNTADYYLGPLRTLQHPLTQPKLPNGYLPKPAPIHKVTLTAKDGVQSTLMTWASTATPSTHSPSRLPILMIPGASVDHTVFALPTIRTNAVDHLTSLGHTVHILTHRFCRTPICASGGTVYEARLDVLAALTHIRATSNSPIHLICHCMGAVSTSIGLLDGTIPAAWLAGLTCTQVFFALRFGRLNALKAGAPLLPALYQKLTGSEWFPMAGDGRAVQAAIDQALRFYPAEGRGEVCSSSVCHRFSLTRIIWFWFRTDQCPNWELMM